MSALNCVLQPTCVLVFADGASCSADGTLISIGSKLLMLPACQAVVGMRGPRDLLAPIAAEIAAANVQAFDDLIDGIVPILDRAFETLFERMIVSTSRWAALLAFVHGPDRVRGHFKRHARAGFEVLLGGWSTRQKASAAYWLRSRDGLALDAVPSGSVSAAPGPTPEAMAALGWSCPDASKFNVRTDGAALMRAQRLSWNHLPGAAIGGFVQAVSVSEFHITSTIVHRWENDVIGRPVLRDTPERENRPTTFVAAAGLRGTA